MCSVVPGFLLSHSPGVVVASIQEQQARATQCCLGLCQSGSHGRSQDHRASRLYESIGSGRRIAEAVFYKQRTAPCLSLQLPSQRSPHGPLLMDSGFRICEEAMKGQNTDSPSRPMAGQYLMGSFPPCSSGKHCVLPLWGHVGANHSAGTGPVFPKLPCPSL